MKTVLGEIIILKIKTKIHLILTLSTDKNVSEEAGWVAQGTKHMFCMWGAMFDS